MLAAYLSALDTTANINMINLAFVFGWWLLCTSRAASNAGADSTRREEVVSLEHSSVTPIYQRASNGHLLPDASSKSALPSAPSPLLETPDLCGIGFVAGGLGAVSILVVLSIVATTLRCTGSSLIGDCHPAKSWQYNVFGLMGPILMGLFSLTLVKVCAGNPAHRIFAVMTVLKCTCNIWFVAETFNLDMDQSVELMISYAWIAFVLNVALGLVQAILILPSTQKSCRAKVTEKSGSFMSSIIEPLFTCCSE